MGLKPSTTWLLVIAATGCRAEFDVSRDELGPFRIAALGVEPGEECSTATASIWSGEGLFHRQSPRLEWSLNGEALGEGWGVSVCEDGLLELKVTSPANDVRYGQVVVAPREETLNVARAAVDLSSLELEARREAEDQEVHSSVPLGFATRVTLAGLSEQDVLAWMSPAS